MQSLSVIISLLCTAILLVFAEQSTTGSSQTLPKEGGSDGTGTPQAVRSELQSTPTVKELNVASQKDVPETSPDPKAHKLLIWKLKPGHHEKAKSTEASLRVGAADALKNITYQIEDQFPNLTKAVKAKIGNAHKKAKSITDRIKNAFKRGWHTITSVKAKIKNELQNAPGGIWNTAVNAGKKVKNGAKEGTKKLLRKLRKMTRAIASLAGFGNKRSNTTASVM